jgi:hypothetical protein
VTVTFWADTDIIHLLIAGSRIKTIRSHLSVADLAILLRQGGRAAGPSPLPLDTAGRPGVVEVDRTVNRDGIVSLGQHVVLAAEILAGRRVGVRIDPTTLAFSTPRPASCCTPGLTRSPRSRSSACGAPVRLAHPHSPRPNLSGSNAVPPTAAWSWSPGRKSLSAASMPAMRTALT